MPPSKDNAHLIPSKDLTSPNWAKSRRMRRAATTLVIASLAIGLSGCVAAQVVGGAASVAGKAAKTTVKAGGAVIDAGVDAVDDDYVPYPDCDDPDRNRDDPCTNRKAGEDTPGS